MIVADTSALVAVLAGEPDAETLMDQAVAADAVALSAGTATELFIVVYRRWGEAGLVRLDALLSELDVSFVDVDERLARLALDGYRRFGRGSGHPAGLNFGDCFAYALARALGAPLLYKGDDFPQTDIEPAVPAP